MTSGVLKLGAVLLFLLPPTVTAQNLADELSEQDFATLVATLDEAGDAGSFPAVLLAATRQAPTLRDLLDLLEKTLPRLAQANESDLPLELFEIAGTALETGNRFSEAGEMYRRAWRLEPARYDMLARAAAMSLETGDGAGAIEALTTVIERAPSVALQRQAAMQRARAYLMTGDSTRALAHAASLATPGASPQAWILLWETATVLENHQYRNDAREYLLEHFPGSPEAALLVPERPGSPGVTFFPGPGRVLFHAARSESAPTIPEPTTPTPTRETAPSQPTALNGIQTGSFRDQENAQYMVSDLREMGLQALIAPVQTEQGRFYRVVIPVDESDPADAEQLVIRLKELGVEGFRVFR